jgi:anti-sigma-K factor RskA
VDPKELISSGQLEQFVLGNLSHAEEQVILEAMKLHPEVKAEINRIEDAMEALDFAMAQAPSAPLKEKVLDSLADRSNTPSIVPIKKDEISFWKALAAACLALAVISLAAAVYFGKEYYQTENRLQSLIAENSYLAQDLNTSNVRLSELEIAFRISVDPKFERIGLTGLDIQPQASLAIWLNKENNETFLMVNRLLELPNDKDYQLWAIVDGQPVDLGIIDQTKPGTFLKVDGVTNAAAYAITIEPKGGLAQPTLDQMCAIGYVS